MVKHNNVVPNGHFKKYWQRFVVTWFDQPGRKKRRRQNRIKKAIKNAPRPIDGNLRPFVRAMTNKYNTKVKLGRGFTLEELKEAGINRKVAPTIGISVDHRRRNHSAETLQRNVQRLAKYQANLIVFPKKNGKFAKGDSKEEELANATQNKYAANPVFKQSKRTKARAITDEEANANAFYTLRMARANKKYKGTWAKRAEEKKKAAK